ncbi:hypothetical protein [Spongiimicrobium salis]|uniref:hypothetical protein n=1 Tax=Spongiimicrobium salis TaxID=1667022 RepID=UPI00374CFA10
MNTSLTVLICFCSMTLYAQKCDTKYKITKIDSTEGNYLIYAQKAKTKLLIISSKETVMSNYENKSNGNIKIGKRYKMKLHEFKLEFASLPPEITPTLTIDNKQVWKKGDDFNVFFSRNLIGLYYVRFPKDL